MQQKALSFWGASLPDPLTMGSAPGPRWGHNPQTPTLLPRYLLFPPVEFYLYPTVGTVLIHSVKPELTE